MAQSSKDMRMQIPFFWREDIAASMHFLKQYGDRVHKVVSETRTQYYLRYSKSQETTARVPPECERTRLLNLHGYPVMLAHAS